jgi:ribA/ribD-fused uncharacterized protein
MINRFDGTEHGFLSNFHLEFLDWEGIRYPHLEAAFQAAKTFDMDRRVEIAQAATPGIAKRMGRRVDLRPDWETVKDSIMLELCTIKFSKEPLRSRLLSTGTEELIEGNTWNDKIWGCVMQNGEWVGQNRLGKTLMQVRNELRISRI